MSTILNSLKWSALSELSTKVLPPLFYIITVRLLTPQDFGIVATSAMVVAFASIIWEAGLAKALIQNQDNSTLDKRSNIVFFTNMTLSVLLYILIFVFADFIASSFHDDRVSDVLKVSAFAMIIGSFMSVHTALFQRDFGFKKLFFSRFVGAITPGVVSIIMAYHGYGYWSLVLGTIASMALQAIILWYLSSWRPTLNYDFTIAKEMFVFSKWVLLSALLSWFFIWGDLFVLGFYFTSHELGLYRTGNYFVGAVLGLITTPIVPVMYSYFSKIQHDIESVKKALLFSSKVVSFFVIPIGVGLFIAQDMVSDLIFGEKWQGLGLVIGYLALMHSIAWIIGLNHEAYKAVGRPDIETKILIATLLFYLVGYIVSAQISFEAFLITRMLLAVGGIGFHIYASKRVFNLRWSDTLLNIKLILFVPSVLLAFSIVVELTAILVFFYLVICFFAYLTVMYIFDRTFIDKVVNILRRRKVDN